MVDAVVAAAGLVKPCGITSIQIQSFKCFPKHAIRSTIIKIDSDCSAFTFLYVFDFHMYILFSKYLGTDILVTLICVLGQDNPDVHRPFLAYLRLPTSTCHIHNIRGTCQLHMEEAFALHIEYILPSHHAVFLRMFLFSYLLFIIYNIYFFAPQTSLIYRSDANQKILVFLLCSCHKEKNQIILPFSFFFWIFSNSQKTLVTLKRNTMNKHHPIQTFIFSLPILIVCNCSYE